MFFPITLVLAVAVFFGYINPEITIFKTANKDYAASLQSLESVKNKKAALELLSTRFKSNEETGNLILNYIPKNKVEEKIIEEVNYIAASSGVLLSNLEITDNFTPVVADVTLQSGPVNVVKSTNAAITVDGDYDKLKIFFDAMQHVPLLNSVESLNISSKEKSAAAGQDAQPQSATTIVARLVINFGYLEQIRADDKKLADFNPEIDNATIQKLKDYTAGHVSKIDMSSVSVGSNNPFLP